MQDLSSYLSVDTSSDTGDSTTMIISRLDTTNELLSIGVDSLIVTVVFLGAILGAHIIRSLRK